MTELLERAVDAARRLSPNEQDGIARAILSWADDGQDPIVLTDAEQTAIAKSRAAARKGEIASDAEVAAVWAKHGL